MDEWNHWERSLGRLRETRHEREMWLRAEGDFILGLAHRAGQRTPTSIRRVLQIGAGPVDVIHYLNVPERFAIDPLADRYKETYAEFQDDDVDYVTGFGESLPYPNDRFDLVVIRNALDHVHSPSSTLKETRRVLTKDGLLYVWVYVYGMWTSFTYRTVNAVTKRYESEPWAFTQSRLEGLLKRYGIEICLPSCTEKYPAETRPPPQSLRGWLARCFLNLPPSGLKGFSCIAKPVK